MVRGDCFDIVEVDSLDIAAGTKELGTHQTEFQALEVEMEEAALQTQVDERKPEKFLDCSGFDQRSYLLVSSSHRN